MPKRVLAEWMAQQWRDGRRTKSKIGSYPALSLADARAIFQRNFAEVILKGKSIKFADDTRPGTVADLFEAYVQSLPTGGTRCPLASRRGRNRYPALHDAPRVTSGLSPRFPLPR
jgi:hypothetical protein